MNIASIVVVAVSLLLIVSASASAQCNPCVSAGVKLSHTFGDVGGFTWGFEVSGAQWHLHNRESGMVGWVVSWDRTGAQDRSRLHLGLQAGYVVSVFSAGLDLGPTIVLKDTDRNEVGLGVVPFVGALTFFPYTAFTIGTSDPMMELGVLAKIPIVTDPINL